MLRSARVGRLVLVLVFVLSLAAPALVLAQATAARIKVTIRGSGSDVTIERSPADSASGRAGAFSRSGFPGAAVAPEPSVTEGVLGDVVRLKAAGAHDTVVLAYLRSHQAELPEVIDAQDVQALRKAGAGKAVLTALSALTAVDIGATGEGRPGAAAAAAPDDLADRGGYEPADASYGYPVLVGYGSPRRHGGFRHPDRLRPMGQPHGRPGMRPPSGAFRRDLGQ